MSTLPFLLSVADELDNIHTQSYMDDFGLGFHPHRQYYRTPTIQLSLPASTDWTGRDWQAQRHGRSYRSYKFYDDSENNLEEEEERPTTQQEQGQQEGDLSRVDSKAHTASTGGRQGLGMIQSKSHDVGVGGMGLNLKDEEDDENIDRTVRMYNLSKKCCKNYYTHALETGPGITQAHARAKCSNLRSESYKSSSSSEESLQQKMPSPIEFLTCFLVKKSRQPKCTHGSGASAGAGVVGVGQQQQLKKT